MSDLAGRFDIGPGADKVRVAEVQFANKVQVRWKLGAGMTSISQVQRNLQALTKDEGNGFTCPAMGFSSVARNSPPRTDAPDAENAR